MVGLLVLRKIAREFEMKARGRPGRESLDSVVLVVFIYSEYIAIRRSYRPSHSCWSSGRSSTQVQRLWALRP